MAVSLSLRVQGLDELQERLNRLSPKKNSAWVARSLVKSALHTQKIAATKKIKRGGKGPPVARILTSRTGTLRRSIRVNRSPLPWAIEVGTDLTYGAVHETGWSGTQRIPAHTRTVAFGRKVAPYRVGSYSRRVDYPERPYLVPGLEEASKDFERFFSSEWAKEMP
jgi:phage gpG-like protein